MPADLAEVAHVDEQAVGDQQPPPKPPKPPWWKEDFDVWRAALERQSSFVWLLGLLSLGGFYVAHAIEGSIGRLHAPGGEQAAGYRDLFFGKIHSSWTTWTDGVDKLSPFKIPGPQTFVRVHVAADTFFVAFGFIALMLLVRADDDPDRRRRRLLWVRVLLAAFVADCVGNVFELGLSWWQWSWLSWLAGLVWVIAVMLYAVGLATVVVQGRQTAVTRWRELMQAPAALRLTFGLALAMAVLLLFSGKIGVQSEDLLERWFNGHWPNGLFTLIGLVLLTFVVGTSRHLVSKNDGHPGVLGFNIVGGLLIAVGLLIVRRHGGYGTLVLGVIVLATGLASITKGDPGETAESSKIGDFGRRPPELECDRAWLRALVVALPVLSLALVMLRSASNRLTAVGARNSPLLLPAAGALGLLFTYAFATFASGPALDPAQQAALRERLAKRKEGRTLKALKPIDHELADWRLAGAFALVTVVAAVLLLVASVCAALARQIGGLGLLTLGLVGAAGLGFAIRAILSGNTTPVAFSRLGFRRTPIATLLLAWIVIASQLNGGTNNRGDDAITYYDVHLIAAASATSAAGAQPTTDCITDQPTAGEAKPLSDVGIAFCHWLATAPAASDGRVPMLLVTAEGGGVRAAGWTAAVLDCLLLRQTPIGCGKAPAAGETEDTTFGRFASLFAANGASGGSVGIASVVAQRLSTPATTGVTAGWIDDKLGGDPLGPTIARAIVDDSVLGLFGTYVGHDRARELELQWGDHWGDVPAYCDTSTSTPVGQLPYLALRDACDQPLPLMLFNGTNVSDGRRVDVAPFDINKPFESADRTVAYDLVDYVCDNDVELFTAAFMSARFPLISSSGRVANHCPGSRDAINIVDGGYGENTGTAQIAEIWDQLAPIIADYNTNPGHSAKLVVPVLLEIKTGEQGIAAPGSGHSRTWGEFFRPIQAFLNVHAGRDSDAEELLVSSFERLGAVGDTKAVHFVMQMTEHPGRTMPLGWTLSSDSIDDLYNQLAISTNTATACAFSKLFDAKAVC